MKKRRAIFAALSAAVLLEIAGLLWPEQHKPAGPTEAVAPAAVSPPEKLPPPSQAAPAGLAEISHEADPLNSPGADIHADLRLVVAMLDSYRSNFPHDGNPVGSNAEITAALTGKNKRRIAFISPKHPAINKAGELCDRWGTPFFFHAESATHMEVRSAGPDRKMWTDDDVVQSP